MLVLVALGRSANGNKLGLENTSIEVNEQGLIKVDNQLQNKSKSYICYWRYYRSTNACTQSCT